MTWIIGNRYELLDALGVGGMGAVYAAYDRLTGQTVALKRVAVAPENLVYNSRPPNSGPKGQLLSLAQEFRILASLRHPHIISVLDYGFDAERHPYFTMELLEQPQTLLQAGRGQPLAVQVNLLLQALQALAYLHRRGILHRDLKPENILVSANRVSVLDFGLSVTHDQAKRATSSGTILYMAPEVLQGKPVTPASDLYAIGVIAYELLTGSHPFYQRDLDQLFQAILAVEPDLSPLMARPHLAQVIGQLLAKEAQQRYQTADAVIAALCVATEQPLRAESMAIRESFIQAATFVGRESDLVGLLAALAAARRGHGSAWLVGGESGVGKSRLLDELRTRALVDGVLVLRGQAVEGGGLAYQLWRAPLRQMVLSCQLSDLDAGVLKEIVPDISSLLQRAIPDAPLLAGTLGQQRLITTILSLFQQLRQPLLLLLEDLQWTTESLAILQAVTAIVAHIPLLIVGTYRDDERPHLTTELPDMKSLRLHRLIAAEIAKLSAAMLGEANAHPQIVDFLERETEGNTFFITEVVRVLAEEAGSLAEVGRMSLPAHVVVGGMQAILRRRLARIPASHLPLLKLAAIVGRQLDVAVLGVLAPTTDVAQWLLVGSETRVLEIQEQQWRFTHDKLRETLLSDLTELEAADLHRQVATAIEVVYPHDQSQAAVLFDHWYTAQDYDKALAYARIAGHYFLDLGVARGALAVLEKALPLVPPGTASELRLGLLNLTAAAERTLGNYRQAITLYQEGVLLARQLGIAAEEATALLGLSLGFTYQGDYATGQHYAEQSLALAQNTEQPAAIARALSILTTISNDQGNMKAARRYAEAALALCRTHNDMNCAANAWCDVGVCLLFEGKSSQAVESFQESLRLCRLIGNRHTMFRPLCNLGFLFLQQGRLGQAADWLEEALVVTRDTGDPRQRTTVLATLGLTRVQMGDYQSGYELLQDALTIAQRIDSQVDQAMALIALCDATQGLNQEEGSETYGQQGLALANQCHYPEAIRDAWVSLGNLACQQGQYNLASQRYEAAIATCRTVDWGLDKQVSALNGMALVAWLEGKREQGEQYLTAAQQINQTVDNPSNNSYTIFVWLLYHLSVHNVAATTALLRAGLQAAWETQSKAQILNILACYAWQYAQTAQYRAAWQLYQLVAGQPALPCFLQRMVLPHIRAQLTAAAPDNQAEEKIGQEVMGGFDTAIAFLRGETVSGGSTLPVTVSLQVQPAA